jgi:hypothetical protein
MKSHKDLDVWKKSMELVTNIYRLTKEFPHEEQFGLSSQMRRTGAVESLGRGPGARWIKKGNTLERG